MDVDCDAEDILADRMRGLGELAVTCVYTSLDNLRCPAFVVDRSGRVLGANRRGDVLVTGKFARLALDGGILRFKVAAANEQLDSFVKKFFAGEGIIGRCFVAPCTLLRLKRTVNWSQGQAILTVRCDSHEFDVSAADLADMLRLSRMQGNLAHALIHGETLGSFAEDAGITKHTAKWHLRMMLPKLRCKTQTDLVRKLCVLLGG